MTAIARRTAPFICAACALAAACLAACLPMQASAGTLNVTPVANEGAVYEVRAVFKGSMFSSELSEVRWPGDEAKAAVLGFISGEGYPEWLEAQGMVHEHAAEKAANAAGYVKEMVEASAPAAGTDTDPATADGASFATRLAWAVVRSGVPAVEVTGGLAATLPYGYYVVTTAPGSVGDGEAGTAPVWVQVGYYREDVVEKATAPSVEAFVRERYGAVWTHAVDAFAGKESDYMVRATMPSNAAALPAFPVEVTAGLEGAVEPGSVSVEVGGADVTGALGDGVPGSVSVTDAEVRVDIDDALAAGASGGGDIVVRFKARARAGAGKVSARLAYPVDGSGSGASAGVDAPFGASRYSYAVRLRAEDAASGEGVEGARFTVKVTGCDGDPEAAGMYVSEGGELSESPFEFVTGPSGEAVVAGLDSGTYEVAQAGAPEGYRGMEGPAELAVDAEVDGESGQLARLSASSPEGSALAVESADADSGEVGAVVALRRSSVALPPTGQAGGPPAAAPALLCAAGLAAAALALGWPRRAAASRRGAAARAACAACLLALALPCWAPGEALADDGGPEVSVRVKGAGDAGWEQATDSFAAQQVECEVRATMPAAIGEYGSCRYRLAIGMQGISFKDASLAAVDVDGEDATGWECVSVTAGGGRDASLAVDMGDVADWPVAPSGDSAVTVRFPCCNYSSRTSSMLGSVGARLEYTESPGSAALAVAEAPRPALNYSYTLKVVNRDRETDEPVDGASYSLVVKEYPQDPGAEGLYVTQYGVPVAYYPSGYTGSDGAVAFHGLDAATYTVYPATAAAGYSRAAAMTLEVESGFDDEGACALSARLSGGQAADEFGRGAARVASVDPEAREIVVETSLDRIYAMPATGLAEGERDAAASCGLVLAGCLAAAGGAAARRRGGRDGRHG